MTTIMIRAKTGRCANGSQLDAGIRYHAVVGRAPYTFAHFFEGKAICGTRPGRRASWSCYQPADVTVTCPAYLARLEKLKANGEEIAVQEIPR